MIALTASSYTTGQSITWVQTRGDSGIETWERPQRKSASCALRVDHVMASACLPTLYQAVEIDGVPYWDGGFMGNPPLYPFFYASDSRDVLVVQINPIERKGAPKSAPEILDRMREITFNASLLRGQLGFHRVPRDLLAQFLHQMRQGRQNDKLSVGEQI